jgi:integrase
LISSSENAFSCFTRKFQVFFSNVGSIPKSETSDIPLETTSKHAMLSAKKRFLDYIRETKSKNTLKSYRVSLSLFEEFYGKSCDEALKERREDVASGDFQRSMRFSRIIEKFHRWLLNQGFSINSARCNTIGIRQFFKFYGVPVMVDSSSGITQTVITTKDFVPTIEQYRKAFNCADLQTRVIISLALDFGCRISDFLAIKRSDLPDLNQTPPIAFEMITQKEKVLAKTFISSESVELLKTYLETLKDNSNPYLFPSNGKQALKPEAINYKLRQAFKKAQIHIPEGKRLRFHSFRKRFLSTCANLKIDESIARILVGKSVDKSMLTYLSDIRLRESFVEVREQNLTLFKHRIKSELEMKDEQIQSLQKRISDLEQIIQTFINMFGKNITEQVRKEMAKEGIAFKPSTLQNLKPYELIKTLIKIKERKTQAEYEKLIQENNNH